MRKEDRTCVTHLTTFVLACMAIGSARCQRTSDPRDAATTTADPAPATKPAVPGVPTVPPPPATFTFDDKKDGVRLQYTSNWVSKPDPDYVLNLVPAESSAPGRRICFDIPDLPPHFPGMIRLGLIEHGYVNDIKGKHKEAQVDSSADHPVEGGAKARLVETSWAQDGGTYKDIALLMMRNDHVYILNFECDAAHLAATRADFDKVAASLQWTK